MLWTTDMYKERLREKVFDVRPGKHGTFMFETQLERAETEVKVLGLVEGHQPKDGQFHDRSPGITKVTLHVYSNPGTQGPVFSDNL